MKLFKYNEDLATQGLSPVCVRESLDKTMQQGVIQK